MYQVYALKYAERDIAACNFFFREASHDPVTLHYYVWLILGGPHPVLVDTGFLDDDASHRGIRNWVSPAAMVERVGVKAADIPLALITHLHYDHWAGHTVFPSAEFWIQREEVAFWAGPYARYPGFRDAANTGFAAFPLVASILARDRCVPRQFSFKGDRLAYSNGILFLAAAASLLLIAFDGQVTNLIPLYAVGVFASFTLSQSGMVRRWLRLREGAWKVSLTINAVGAVATGVVTVVIVGTKFVHGAWISILMMMLLMALFTLIRRHYDRVEGELKVEEGSLLADIPAAMPAERLPWRVHVVVPVDSLNRITAAAIRFSRELSSMITAVHITDDREEGERFREQWEREVPDVPLLLIESPYRAFVAPMLAYVESLERAEPDVGITVVLPGLVTRHWWERLLHNQDVRRLKPHLEKRPRVRVFDFPYRPGEDEGG